MTPDAIYQALLDLTGEVSATAQAMRDHEKKDEERHADLRELIDKSAESSKSKHDNRVSRAFAAALVLLAGCFTLGGVALAHALR